MSGKDPSASVRVWSINALTEVSLALLLAWDLRFLRTLSDEGNAIELVPTLRFGLCSSSSGDALGSMIGKMQLARVMARMEKKMNAASSDDSRGNLMARPLKIDIVRRSFRESA